MYNKYGIVWYCYVEYIINFRVNNVLYLLYYMKYIKNKFKYNNKDEYVFIK